jgi:hypothetical protein
MHKSSNNKWQRKREIKILLPIHDGVGGWNHANWTCHERVLVFKCDPCASFNRVVAVVVVVVVMVVVVQITRHNKVTHKPNVVLYKYKLCSNYLQHSYIQWCKRGNIQSVLEIGNHLIRMHSFGWTVVLWVMIACSPAGHTNFYPEDGGDMFLWNVGNRLQNYTVSQPRRQPFIF